MDKKTRIFISLCVVTGLLLNITSSCNKEAKIELPTLTTKIISDITQASASCGGSVNFDGGSTVTVRGVCWNAEHTPTINDSKTNDGTGVGNFTSAITDLIANTTYHVRAYAMNAAGTSYGNEIIFATWNWVMLETISDYDNNTYTTIQIGTQVWMKENLKVTHYRNGNAIPNSTDNITWSNSTTGAYCWNNNDESNKATYGALYNFYTTVDNRNLCPTGWHVPSEIEWAKFMTYLGNINDIGGKLKESGFNHWEKPNTGATNESGFTVLPGGCRDDSGLYSFVGSVGVFWSSTTATGDSNYAWTQGIGSNYIYVTNNGFKKKYGFSVRCVKD